MVEINFQYDEESGKWEVTALGCQDQTEAKQAFNAVILTTREVIICLEHVVTPTNNPTTYKLEPAVTLQGLMQSGGNYAGD